MSLNKYKYSTKFRWFLILQIGFTITNVVIYIVLNPSLTHEYVTILINTWIEFTWKNVALYSTANIATKAVNNTYPNIENPNPTMEQKRQSRKYKIFVYLQIFISLIVGYQIFISFPNFEYVNNFIQIWTEFTWVNIGVFFFGNIGAKYTYYQEKKNK